MTYQSFRCVSSEERLARLAGYGIKVVSKSSVPTHAAVFILFILACLMCQVIRTQVHWSMVRICHAWHGVAVWIFKAAMTKKTKIKATAIISKLSIWMFLFLLSPSLSSQSISDLLSLSLNHIFLLTEYCCWHCLHRLFGGSALVWYDLWPNSFITAWVFPNSLNLKGKYITHKFRGCLKTCTVLIYCQLWQNSFLYSKTRDGRHVMALTISRTSTRPFLIS